MWKRLLLIACMTTSVLSAQSLQPPKAPVVPSYKIGADDVLHIYVHKSEDISRQYIVRPDGRISFPFIKDVQAAGLSPVELAEKMEKELDEFIPFASVTVVVEAIRSYRIYVLGNVQKQGEIVQNSPITVTQAISLSLGFTEFAKKEEVLIIRGKGESRKAYIFNYLDFVKTKNFSQDIVLQTGDQIIVP